MTNALTIAPKWEEHQRLLIEVATLRMLNAQLVADNATLNTERAEAASAAWLAERGTRQARAERDEWQNIATLLEGENQELEMELQRYKAALAAWRERCQ